MKVVVSLNFKNFLRSRIFENLKFEPYFLKPAEITTTTLAPTTTTTAAPTTTTIVTTTTTGLMPIFLF